MITFASLVGFAALAVACIVTAAFTGPLGTSSPREYRQLLWLLLTIGLIAAAVIAAGAAFGTLFKAVVA